MYQADCFDVVVVGGGSAGVAAAVAAARAGAKVALVERYGFLGGAATASLVMTYDGFFYQRPQAEWAVGGVGRELLDRLATYGTVVKPLLSANGNWIVPFEPEAAKVALDAMLLEAGVCALLHGFVCTARKSGQRLERITLQDHGGMRELCASQFVDASGEADVAWLAGVPMLFADEGRFAASLCARIGGVPPHVELHRNVLMEAAALANERGLAQTPYPLSPTPLPQGGEGLEIARHSSPLPLVGEGPGERELRPSGKKYCGIATIRESGGFALKIPNSHDYWWMGVDVFTDGLRSHSLAEAERASRAAVWAFVQALQQQLGCETVNLVTTGPQLGVRETRHPQARAMLTEADARAGTRSATAIARAAWNIERHDVAGQPVTGKLGGDDFYDIPLPALQAVGVDNLWLAGRTIGADRTAYSSLRVMGTAFATGQAAGVAAALHAAGKPSYQDIRAVLLAQDAIL